MILGVDEVGRGPWAGPLVVGAVVLGGTEIPGLTDSKRLSKKRREELDIIIRKKAEAVALGWVDASELDKIGMSEALRLATRRAVEQIRVPYSEIIIDGTINFLSGTGKGAYVTTLAKADALIPSVSAASIVAKVARDRYMSDQDKIYPRYGFASHAGYGVAKHREAIERLGVTPLHRLSFSPLAEYRNGGIKKKEDAASSRRPTARDIGNTSEEAAANYLEGRGHTVIERNWRTRWCEIDIISTYGGVIYFTEVKHRKSDATGGGIEAITASKYRQMEFAAKLYAANRPDSDLRLAVIATTGAPAEVLEFLEIDR